PSPGIIAASGRYHCTGTAAIGNARLRFQGGHQIDDRRRRVDRLRFDGQPLHLGLDQLSQGLLVAVLVVGGSLRQERPQLLPVADALCRFNPVYGQGMSVAAQEARLLQHVLSRAASEPDPIAALQAGFMAEVASVLETPWGMSTGPDLAFPSTRGSRPENFEEVQQFQAALFRAAVVDSVVHRTLTDVAQLLQSQSLLREPDMTRRIEAA